MQISSYFASLGFKVDNKELRKVDNHLKTIEMKLKKFSSNLDRTLKLKLNIEKFDVDQRKLNLALGNALDLASSRLTFQIDRFDINQAVLNQQMAAAARRASQHASVRVSTRVGNQGIPGEGIRGRHIAAAGGIGGLAARMYTPALTLGLGGYGLAALNRRNQEVVSAQLQSQAVIQQAGGTQAQGAQSFDFLRSEANRIGFNYLESAGDYNKLIAGLTGSGVGIQDSQQVFTGFAELARTNKLDRVTQNRLFRALSQVAGKGKLQAEELTGQISEALPGGTALFAQAYQQMIGGNLTGQEAVSALMAQMKQGNVRSEVLTYAARLASQRAQPTLQAASRASQAEQARFQNQVSDTALRASGAGLETGFSRLFRSLTTALKEAQPMVDSLARGFDKASQFASSLLLSVQSVQRFFQGRDSLFGDKFFPDEESQQKAFLFLENFKSLMSEMDMLTTNIYNGWSQLLGLIDSSPVLDKLNTTLSLLSNTAGAVNRFIGGDYTGAGDAAISAGKTYGNFITSVGRGGANALLSPFTDYRIPAPFDKGQSQIDWATQYKAEQAKMAAESRNQYMLPGVNRPLAPGQQANDLSIKMDVEIKAANPEDFNQQFQDRFKAIISDTLSQFPQKE